MEPGDRLLGELKSWMGSGPFASWMMPSVVPSHEGGILLQLAQMEDARISFHLHLRERDDGRPAWKRTQSLDVIHQTPPGLSKELYMPVSEAFVAALTDLEFEWEGEFTLPREVSAPGAPVRPARRLDLPEEWVTEVPSPFDWGKVFVLTPISDCGQSCSFCSVRAGAASGTGESASVFEGYVDALQRARDEGYTRLRISGFDPLEYPQILPLLQTAKDLGYEEVFLYSPGRALGSLEWTQAFLNVLPEQWTLFLPVYGAIAADHDQVVGRPGAFDELSQGIRHLEDLDQMGHVVFMTVASREVAPGLPAIQELVAQTGRPIQVFQPWPASRSEEDAFYEQALSHEEVLTFLMACRPPLGLPEVLPCIRFRHEQMTGEKALTEGGFRRNPALMATLYEFDLYRKATDGEGPNQHVTPVVDCPHAQACSLAHLCPGEVYRAYGEKFGLGGLQPVGLWDLIPLFHQEEVDYGF